MSSLVSEYPDVKCINVQSDNAKCYQSGSLLLGMLIICDHYHIGLKSFIHTETQDGKGSIDGHFAICMKHVNSFVNTGFNVTSPRELFMALHWDGGPKSTTEVLFSVNMCRVQSLVKA